MREYGSEHPAIIVPDGYFNSFKEYNRDVLFLRSGREALLLSAKTVKNIQLSKDAKIDGESHIILFPAYCCWSMTAPFEKTGWKIVYYKLNKDLTADIKYLKKLLITCNPQAILTMNFFGSAYTNEAIETIKDFNENIIVIEDFSHCTFSLREIYNPKVDIYVSSIRKSIGICDGSAILSKIPLKKELVKKEVTDFTYVRYKAQLVKQQYQWNNDKQNKHEFLKDLHNGECILNEFNTVHQMSERAKKMLKIINGKEIAYARRENMRHIMHLLNGKIRLVPGIENCLDGAPFSLPILVNNRDRVQSQLSSIGVYAPVLWPLNEEAKKVCIISKMMGEQMLSIPIDQRYDWHDIELIAKRILNILKRT